MVNEAALRRITADNAKNDIANKLGSHVKLIEDTELIENVRVLVTDDTTWYSDKDGEAEVTTRRITTYQADVQISQLVLKTTTVRKGNVNAK